MSLQTALIGLGIILMSLVYVVSKFYDRRSNSGNDAAGEDAHRNQLDQFPTDPDALLYTMEDRLDYEFDDPNAVNINIDLQDNEIDSENQIDQNSVDLDSKSSADIGDTGDLKDRATGFDPEHEQLGGGVENSRIEPVFDSFDCSDDEIENDRENGNLVESGRNGSGSGYQESPLNPASPEQSQAIESDDQSAVARAQKTQSTPFKYPQIAGFEKISQIDYWVKISGDRDVGRESVLAQYRDSASGIGKPTRIYGIRIPDQNWCDLEMESEETRFQDIIVTVQLIDDAGPVSDSDLDKFTMLVSGLSEGTGRGFTFMASIESASEQAQSLASFVQHFDLVFVVNVRPTNDEYLDGGSILRCATQLGLEQGENRFFVRNKMVGKNKVCLYSLANSSETGEFDFDNIRALRTKGVTFFTKPSVNRSPGAVFSEMVDTAKAFAARIKGEAVSSRSEDLFQDDIDEIRQSIEQVAAQMEELGMAAGSDEAMRVFK